MSTETQDAIVEQAPQDLDRVLASIGITAGINGWTAVDVRMIFEAGMAAASQLRPELCPATPAKSA
jgi:hypothetical protein